MPESGYSGWGCLAGVAVIVLALIGPGYVARADPNSIGVIRDVQVRAQASPSPAGSPEIVGLAPSLPLPEPAPVVAAVPSPEQTQPTGGSGGGGGGGGAPPPPPPPACKPSIPGNISASPGSVTQNSYDGNSGSWTVHETGAHPISVSISISGMVGCGGGKHHTLRATDGPNFQCNPTMGSSVGVTLSTYNDNANISVTVTYDAGC